MEHHQNYSQNSSGEGGSSPRKGYRSKFSNRGGAKRSSSKGGRTYSNRTSSKNDYRRSKNPKRSSRPTGRSSSGFRDSRDMRSPKEFIPLEPDDPQAAPFELEGVIEVSSKGFGVLRDPKRCYVASLNDPFISLEIMNEFSLRNGMRVKAEVQKGKRGAKCLKLLTIEGEEPQLQSQLLFEELTTINPNEHIRLATERERYTTRVIDMLAPIGKGQRGLVVAPPRTGKTTLLEHIATGVIKNHPQMKLIILLVDERPEELTEMRRTFPEAEVFASTNDSDIKSHVQISQLAVERAKRLVEYGKDVFIIMDSLTRIGRAFNNATGGGGRTMSGGMDSRAMEIPRKLFAAARNTEEAGSLTIIASALIETNSRMDELIFQEFKGTGNMELVLDRKISDQRIYPAVDIFLSGTRREELLLPAELLRKINIIRRGLAGHKPLEAIERILFFMRKYPNNEELLHNIPG